MSSIPSVTEYLRAYRWVLRARLLENRLASIYRSGKIVGGVYLSRGQEAFSAALACSLQEGDVFGPLIRDTAGRLAFGQPMLDLVRTYFGSAEGPMRGRDGNVHHGRPRENLPAMISHLGSMISLVSGMVYARRKRGDIRCIGATSIGNGGMSTGSAHEGINLAAVEKLPVLIAVADNQYAYSTPNSRQFACRDLVDRAAGYGIPGHSVDGTDLGECLAVFARAAEDARNGGGPQMVVGKMLRLSGHGEHDDGFYVTEEMKNSPLGRDCLEVARDAIRENAWAAETELTEWESEISREIDEAVRTAQSEAPPDALTETWQALSNPAFLDGN